MKLPEKGLSPLRFSIESQCIFEGDCVACQVLSSQVFPVLKVDVCIF